MSEEQCLLCTADKLTTWHYEDDLWWVADCLTCNVPMVVYREHTILVPVMHLDTIYKVLQNANPGLKLDHFDFVRREIPDHYHFHLRGL